MINIVVEGQSDQYINTLASHIAMLLYNEGFDVVVNSSDEINAELATKDRLHKVKNTMIGMETKQLPRE